jgi:hypothetical protein
MKITPTVLRKLIKEEIKTSILQEVSLEDAVASLQNSLSRLMGELNYSDPNQLDSVFQQAKQNLTSDAPANRKEKKWSDADHDKQEDIAKEIEKENPGISKEKKMAFAGAQVNRDKRKRNK